MSNQDAFSSESKLTEAEMLQILLGHSEVNSLIAYIKLRDESLTREEARSRAKEIKKYLDEKMMAAQKADE